MVCILIINTYKYVTIITITINLQKNNITEIFALFNLC